MLKHGGSTWCSGSIFSKWRSPCVSEWMQTSLSTCVLTAQRRLNTKPNSVNNLCRFILFGKTMMTGASAPVRVPQSNSHGLMAERMSEAYGLAELHIAYRQFLVTQSMPLYLITMRPTTAAGVEARARLRRAMASAKMCKRGWVSHSQITCMIYRTTNTTDTYMNTCIHNTYHRWGIMLCNELVMVQRTHRMIMKCGMHKCTNLLSMTRVM